MVCMNNQTCKTETDRLRGPIRPLVAFRRFVMLCLFALFLGQGSAHAQSYPPVWNNTSNYVAGDMVTDYGNVYRCIKAVNTHYLDPSKTYQNWELTYVRSGTTIVIGTGQPFPDLKTAWTYIENATIAQAAYLHLNISTANGTHSEQVGNGFVLNHPFGPKISIIGDSPSRITFATQTGSNGFVIDTGYTFGSLSNVGLESSTPTGYGLLASGTLLSVSGISMSNFYEGVYAGGQGQVYCMSPISFGGIQSTFFDAEQGGTIFVAAGQEMVGSVSQTPSGTGIFATQGGKVYASSCVISKCHAGMYATGEGLIVATGCQITGSQVAVEASYNGRIYVENSTFSSNSTDLSAVLGASVDAGNSTYTTSSVGKNDGSYIY